MALQTFTAGQVLTAAQLNTLQTNNFNQTVSTKVASYVLVGADKGTRIVMNLGSATTITVNTGLFAAGDTLFIQNIGAGPCTITAGTATVTSSGSLILGQWESGTLYFTSTGAAIFIPSQNGNYQTWAPILGGGWLNGNGVWNARYTQIGETVIASASFVLGSTTTKGTTLTCTLPVTMRDAALNYVATVRYTLGSTIYYGVANTSSTSVVLFKVNSLAGSYLSDSNINASTIPGPWATNDKIQFNLIYEAA
jgi:hypothetical protein